MSKNENKNTKKYITLEIVALILSFVIEFILVKSSTFSQFSLGNILVLFGLISFIGLHFVMGFKKLYNFIIDNRYIISIVLIIASTIAGFMQNELTIKDWILATNIPLCLWWNIKFFAIILASYELMIIITENRYYSAIFSCLISMSGAVQWNFEYIDAIILGEIFVVIFNNIITNEKLKNKILYSAILIAIAFAYMQRTISVAISFSYIWLALIIWILIKNKEKLKNNKILFGTIPLTIVSIILSLYFDLGFRNDPIMKTKGFSYLFTYIYNILLPFTNIENKYLYGNFISIFPIPMLVAIYYIYNHDEHIEFLLPLTLVSVVETIFCISGLPQVINTILGFTNISTVRVSIAVNYANLLLIFYMISNIDEIFKLKTAVRLTLVSICLLAFIKYPSEFSSRLYLYLFAAEICVLFLLFYNYGNKKYKKVFLFFIVLFTLISGITVNPILKDKSKNISSLDVTTVNSTITTTK